MHSKFIFFAKFKTSFLSILQINRYSTYISLLKKCADEFCDSDSDAKIDSRAIDIIPAHGFRPIEENFDEEQNVDAEAKDSKQDSAKIETREKARRSYDEAVQKATSLV